MIEFRINGEALWARMERAVEKVNERLRGRLSYCTVRSFGANETERIPSEGSSTLARYDRTRHG